MASDVNKQYAEQAGVETTPTFILFDASGRELRRWVGEAPGLGDLPGGSPVDDDLDTVVPGVQPGQGAFVRFGT
jgi:hypothetical protein